MMRRLNVQDDEWDVAIIGDGSGQRWDIGAGWASILVDKRSRRRKLFYGGMNCGTVYISEIMPYLHAMQWYSWYLTEHVENRKPTIRVHCVTDNKAVATQGAMLRSGVVPASIKKQRELWMALGAFAQRGLLLDFTFVPRSEIALNVYADDVSRKARLIMSDVQLPTTKVANPETGKKEPQAVSIYDVHCDNFEDMGKKPPKERRKL